MVAYGDVIEVVQNSQPNLVMQKLYTRDERKRTTPEDLTSYTEIRLSVKRRQDDTDAFEIFNLLATRAPTSVNGTALSNANGEYAFLLTPAHTMLAPGDYFGMIDFYIVANNPPEERIPITYRVIQAIQEVLP